MDRQAKKFSQEDGDESAVVISGSHNNNNHSTQISIMHGQIQHSTYISRQLPQHIATTNISDSESDDVIIIDDENG